MSKRKRSQDERDADGAERKAVKRHKNSQRADTTVSDDIKHEDVLAHSREPMNAQDRVTDSKVDRRAAKIQRRKEPRERKADVVAERGQTKNSEERKEHGKGRRQKKTLEEQKQHDKRRRRKKKSEEQKEQDKRRRQEGLKWTISKAIGGQMLDLDPLFSPDEESLLLAFDNTIDVYSTTTSLLVRRLIISKSEIISGFDFSSVDSTHLFVSTLSGSIHKWDWINGKRIEFWDTKTPIHSIRTSGPAEPQGDSGLVYTLDEHTKKRWLLTAHRLVGGREAEKTALVVLLTYGKPLTSLKVLDEGKVIIATAGSKMLIGNTQRPNEPSLKDVTYTWREFDCSTWITSIDIQVNRTDVTSKSSRESQATASAINIVIGGIRGSIFVYDDILEKLTRKENSRARLNNENIDPRKLHWHRNAVASVKWSADGNYVISGGQETVLAIWQLETGFRQDLPHLSAAIESIVVSPGESSYAIRLADNSAMILSTSELKPTFSTAGIQIPAMRKEITQTPFIPTVDAPNKRFQDTRMRYLRWPATTSSHSANRLLFAVPAMTSSNASKQACYLQSLDPNSAQQVSRQALTRTNVTTVNIGPESNQIEEPSVTLMTTSHDGHWLATVDEWKPSQVDLAYLAYDETAAEEQHLRLESYLKFWSWDESLSTWVLVARVDNAHTAPSGHPCKILDLASDPSHVGFATVGEDGVVRIWQPTIRRRRGLQVRDKAGSSLTTWSCRQKIELQRPSGIEEARPEAGKLAFSTDSSVLAAAIHPSQSSAINLLSPSSGTIHSTPSHLYSGALHGLGILHKYLITLSTSLHVWDMVTRETHFGFTLQPIIPPVPQTSIAAITHLAISPQSHTFAIAIPESTHQPGGGLKSHIAVFRPDDPDPLRADRFSTPITNLLPIAAGAATASPRRAGGYYAVDANAELRTLTPLAQLLPPLPHEPPPHPTSAPKDRNRLANIYGPSPTTEPPLLAIESFRSEGEDGNGDGDEKRVVRTEELAALFEDTAASYALPHVGELYERVARLFAGRDGGGEGAGGEGGKGVEGTTEVK